MRFAAIAIAVGLAGTFLAAYLQGGAIVPGEGVAGAMLVDDTLTGSVADRDGPPAADAMRLIDLRSGATCKMVRPDPDARTFQIVPFGPDCAKAAGLSRITYWRSTPDGSLIMADSGGGTVLEFAPGDGVLYESVYPENELITIVPAKS